MQPLDADTDAGNQDRDVDDRPDDGERGYGRLAPHDPQNDADDDGDDENGDEINQDRLPELVAIDAALEPEQQVHHDVTPDALQSASLWPQAGRGKAGDAAIVMHRT